MFERYMTIHRVYGVWPTHIDCKKNHNQKHCPAAEVLPDHFSPILNKKTWLLGDANSLYAVTLFDCNPT